ncbi:hypothetical protein P3T23_003573 [Paraburkholderia sp. GAS448]|uniref:hypothetical protein n=1 Tax=Paraburkholderia sp. GAS448 TaxID=3035136 RepID=UPI003D249810
MGIAFRVMNGPEGRAGLLLTPPRFSACAGDSRTICNNPRSTADFITLDDFRQAASFPFEVHRRGAQRSGNPARRHINPAAGDGRG